MEWIKTEVCQPELGKDVLIVYRGRMFIGWGSLNVNGIDLDFILQDKRELKNITYWMELPKVPK